MGEAWINRFGNSILSDMENLLNATPVKPAKTAALKTAGLHPHHGKCLCYTVVGLP